MTFSKRHRVTAGEEVCVCVRVRFAKLETVCVRERETDRQPGTERVPLCILTSLTCWATERGHVTVAGKGIPLLYTATSIGAGVILTLRCWSCAVKS